MGCLNCVTVTGFLLSLLGMDLTMLEAISSTKGW